MLSVGPHRNGASPKMPDYLPIERDFDPHGCGLDEQCAWRNFGGLTLDEACKKFETAPGIFQEDFMFMGSKAFAFYYPVIDRFLRNTITLTDAERGDRQSWILPQCILAQFDEANRESVVRLKASVLALCKFMLENIDCFKDDWEVPSEIEMQWRSLQLHVDRF